MMSRTPTQPTVWVTEENEFDYTPAEAYGRIVVLKAPKFSAGVAESSWNANIVHSLRKQLLPYSPDDFLILTGNPVRQAVCKDLISEHGWKKTQYLNWDGRAYRYVLLVIDTGVKIAT